MSTYATDSSLYRCFHECQGRSDLTFNPPIAKPLPSYFEITESTEAHQSPEAFDEMVPLKQEKFTSDYVKKNQNPGMFKPAEM